MFRDIWSSVRWRRAAVCDGGQEDMEYLDPEMVKYQMTKESSDLLIHMYQERLVAAFMLSEVMSRKTPPEQNNLEHRLATSKKVNGWSLRFRDRDLETDYGDDMLNSNSYNRIRMASMVLLVAMAIVRSKFYMWTGIMNDVTFETCAMPLAPSLEPRYPPRSFVISTCTFGYLMVPRARNSMWKALHHWSNDTDTDSGGWVKGSLDYLKNAGWDLADDEGRIKEQLIIDHDHELVIDSGTRKLAYFIMLCQLVWFVGYCVIRSPYEKKNFHAKRVFKIFGTLILTLYVILPVISPLRQGSLPFTFSVPADCSIGRAIYTGQSSETIKLIADLVYGVPGGYVEWGSYTYIDTLELCSYIMIFMISGTLSFGTTMMTVCVLNLFFLCMFLGVERTEYTTQACILCPLISAVGLHVIYNVELSNRTMWLLRKESELIEQRQNALLINILPPIIVEELRIDNLGQCVRHKHVTMVMADIVGFTSFANATPASQVMGVVQRLFVYYDRYVSGLGMFKVCTIGDGYVAMSNPVMLDTENDDDVRQMTYNDVLGSMKAVILGASMIQRMKYVKGSALDELEKTLDLRVGIHYGNEFVGSLIASKPVRYDIWGHDVVVANRMEQNSTKGEINCSEDFYSLYNDAIKPTMCYHEHYREITFYNHGCDTVPSEQSLSQSTFARYHKRMYLLRTEGLDLMKDLVPPQERNCTCLPPILASPTSSRSSQRMMNDEEAIESSQEEMTNYLTSSVGVNDDIQLWHRDWKLA